jgi:hypothetical protein
VCRVSKRKIKSYDLKKEKEKEKERNRKKSTFKEKANSTSFSTQKLSPTAAAC